MNGSDWSQFAKEQALQAHGVRLFGQPPAGLQVDAACPDCGQGDRWVRTQVLGETPGRTDVDEYGRIFARPAQRGGVKMMCYHCGAQFTYRDLPFTDGEQAQRTAKLFAEVKTGRLSL